MHLDSSIKLPGAAVAAIQARVRPLAVERIPLSDAAGRVLAEPVLSDRPNPPCAVSAMDGFALRSKDAAHVVLPIDGEAAAGMPPTYLAPGHARRIYTGAALPSGADTVIRREDTEERGDVVDFSGAVGPLMPGHNVRQAGENAAAGTPVLEPGTQLGAAAIASAAAFGAVNVQVYRPARVAVIVTGDELLPSEARPQFWQIRDSNGPMLQTFFAQFPWLSITTHLCVADEPAAISAAVERGVESADAVVMTGGVSMGHRDFVPEVLTAAGVDVIFHRLPIRPGKPILGGVTPNGLPVFGLPGNPVSALVCARRFVLPVLAQQAGLIAPPTPMSVMAEPTGESLKLCWFRLVQRHEDGSMEVLQNRGSGDIVALGKSDGFIEQRAGEPLGKLAPYYSWSSL